MKKLLIIALVLLTFVTMASAQKQAEIKFDKLSVDLGTFQRVTQFVKPLSYSQTQETLL